MVTGRRRSDRRLRPARFALALVLAGSTTLAHAEVPSTERDRARDSFREGAALTRAGDLDAAVAAFERSLELYPHASTHYNLGLAEEGRANKAQAAEHFRRALERAAADPSELPAEARRSAQEHLSALERELSPPSSAVEPPAPMPPPPSTAASVPVTPAPVAAAAVTPLPAAEPVRVPAPPTRPQRSPLVIPAFGVAAVGAVSAAIFGSLALAKKAELDRRCPDPSACPPGTADDAKSLQHFAIAADVSLAFAVVGAGVGAYAWFADGSPTGTSAGATVSGSF